VIPGYQGAPPKPPKRGKKAPKPIPRGKRPNRVRQTVAGKESEALDRLFSKYIRLRDRSCRVALCLSESRGQLVPAPSTECSHLLGVGPHPRLKWDSDNAVGACHACHRFTTTHPTSWSVWIIQNCGAEKFEELHERSRSGPKPDRDSKRKWLTAAIKTLGGER
jgi:hypothetical protein